MKRRIWLNPSKGHSILPRSETSRLAHFSHFSILISSIEVLPKCIASCSFSEVILVLFSNFNGVGHDFKGYFQGQKGPIWTFVIYLGQYLRNGACCDQCLYEEHIQSHIWSLSWPCDLWPWITFKGQIKVTDSQGVVSHKWCIIWSKFVWNTYSKSYMAFSVSNNMYDIWPLMKLKGQIKVIGFLVGYIS